MNGQQAPPCIILSTEVRLWKKQEKCVAFGFPGHIERPTRSAVVLVRSRRYDYASSIHMTGSQSYQMARSTCAVLVPSCSKR